MKHPDLRNCLVTSYKAADRIAKGTINDIELEDIIECDNPTIIAEKFCKDNYAYLFDEEGELVATFIFEDEE